MERTPPMGNATRKQRRRCGVRNPALERPYEDIIRERRSEFAANMHIVHMADDRYHVVSIPGSGEEPLHAWPGPWETEAAAGLFMDDLLDACAEGSPADAYCSD